MDRILLIILFCFNVITLVSIFALLINRRLKERKQKLEEEKYDSLFSKSNDAIMIIKNGVVVESNEKFFSLFGYEENEVIGEDPFKLSSDRQPDQGRAPRSQRCRAGRFVERGVQISRRDPT